MGIKIIKGALPPKREPAPLVEDAPKATVVPSQAAMDAQTIAWWQKHGLEPGAKPVLCKFCGHPYLKPCDEEKHVRCQNFHVIQRRAKANESR